MIGIEVSKYKLWYDGQRNHDRACTDCYITERTLIHEDLEELINEANETLAYYGLKMYEEASFGYECYDSHKHLKLQQLRDSMEKYRNQLTWANLDVKPCLSDRDLQLTFEQARKLVIKGCCRTAKSPIKIDKSGESKWIKNNPYCVAREKWEALAYKVCGDINFKVTAKEVACDITYIVTSEGVDCTLHYAIEGYKTDCKIDFKVKYGEWENSGCRTSYDDCKKLAKCGIEFDYIVSMQKCGIATSYNTKKNCPEITYKGKTVSLKDIELGPDYDPKTACSMLEKIIL